MAIARAPNQSESGKRYGDKGKLLELACLLPIACWYNVGSAQMFSWMKVESIGFENEQR